jgi:alkylated DNA repair dioxygenase AlkB
MSRESVEQELKGPNPITMPDGFAYFPDALTRPEAEWLAGKLLELPFERREMRGRLTKRKTYCFGRDYDPQRRSLRPMPTVPEWLDPVRDRCAELARSRAEDFTQAIVSLYGERDAKIGPHVDHHRFGPVVLGLSLLSPVEMKFEREGVRFVRTIEPGSVYVIGGEARWLWKHSTGRVSSPPRLSVTFRSLAGGVSVT